MTTTKKNNPVDWNNILNNENNEAKKEYNEILKNTEESYNKISKKIMVSRPLGEKESLLYLMYIINEKYYLLHPDSKGNYIADDYSIEDTPEDLRESLTNSNEYNNDLKYIIRDIERYGHAPDSHKTLWNFIQDLEMVHDEIKTFNSLKLRNEYLSQCNNEKVFKIINDFNLKLPVNDNELQTREIADYIASVTKQNNATNYKLCKEVLKDLDVKYIEKKDSKDPNEPEKTFYWNLNSKYKRTYIYRSFNIYDFQGYVNDVYNVSNWDITSTNVKNAEKIRLGKIKINYNYIEFKNGLFNVSENKLMKTDKPVLPYLHHSNINYYKTPTNMRELKEKYGNSHFIKYVTTSLHIEKEQMAFIEYLGYCMIAGNTKTIVMNFMGLAGSGKSIGAHTINMLVGDENYSSFDYDDFCDNKSRTEQFTEAYQKLVIVDTDCSNKKIKNTDKMKKLSGGDPVRVEFKFKNKWMLKEKN